MGRSVLLCDDDRLFTLWLTRLLREWGWSVQATQNVADGLSAFESCRPDVLVVDLYIGDETAADLLQKLNICDSSSLPILLVSAASSAEMQSVMCGTEMTMLSKPVDPARLKAILSELTPTLGNGNEKTLSFLILDNGGIQAKVLGRMVEDAGAFVIFASSIENAKTLIRNVRPDAVLIESDGSAQDAEALSAYCVATRLSLPPMIVLLSVINQSLVEKLLRAGVVDILLKPISVNRLQESIRRVGGRVEKELPGRAEGRRNIMVVEDFTITAKMLERLLSREGYQVYVVRSAEMAYEMIRRIRPDLMLLDLNLPGMSGLDLLQSLNATGQAVPTVITTGDRDPRKLREIRKLGTLRLFNKPIVPDELISYIRGFFSESGNFISGRADYDVLLAMADDVAGSVLAGALEVEGLKCKVVNDGYQTVHEIMTRPRVAVLDVVISGLDGTEVMRRTRAALSTGKTKLLAIAEDLDNDIADELREMGAHDCLGKPYSLAAMKEKIHTLLAESAPRISVQDVAHEILPEIRRAMTLPDEDLFIAAARLGHNLKGTAELAGIPSIVTLARALEDAARTRYRGSCEDILKDMRQEIDRALTSATT